MKDLKVQIAVVHYDPIAKVAAVRIRFSDGRKAKGCAFCSPQDTATYRMGVFEAILAATAELADRYRIAALRGALEDGVFAFVPAGEKVPEFVIHAKENEGDRRVRG